MSILNTPKSTSGFGRKLDTTYVTPSAPTHVTPLNQHKHPQSQPLVNGHQHIVQNYTDKITIIVESDCNLARLLPLLSNSFLRDDTLIG